MRRHFPDHVFRHIEPNGLVYTCPKMSIADANKQCNFGACKRYISKTDNVVCCKVKKNE